MKRKLYLLTIFSITLLLNTACISSKKEIKTKKFIVVNSFEEGIYILDVEKDFEIFNYITFEKSYGSLVKIRKNIKNDKIYLIFSSGKIIEGKILSDANFMTINQYKIPISSISDIKFIDKHVVLTRYSGEIEMYILENKKIELIRKTNIDMRIYKSELINDLIYVKAKISNQYELRTFETENFTELKEVKNDFNISPSDFFVFEDNLYIINLGNEIYKIKTLNEYEIIYRDDINFFSKIAVNKEYISLIETDTGKIIIIKKENTSYNQVYEKSYGKDYSYSFGDLYLIQNKIFLGRSFFGIDIFDLEKDSKDFFMKNVNISYETKLSNVYNDVLYTSDTMLGISLHKIKGLTEYEFLGKIEQMYSYANQILFYEGLIVTRNNDKVEIFKLNDDFTKEIVFSKEQIRYIDIYNSYLYILDTNLQVYSLKNPDQIYLEKTVETRLPFSKIKISEENIFLLDHGRTVTVLDKMNYEIKNEVRVYGNDFDFNSDLIFAIDDRSLSVGSFRKDNNFVRIPIPLGERITDWYGLDNIIKVYENYLYISISGYLLIMDISEPYEPKLLNYIECKEKLYSLNIVEDVLYLSEGISGIKIYDLSKDPVNPEMVYDFNSFISSDIIYVN